MTTASDRELLQAWREHGEEPAFAALVRRHLDVVHAVALRGCGGDAPLAQDVTQRVFVDLARKAGALAARESIAGWLYLAARNAVAMAVRSEQRRRVREHTAQTMQQLDSEPAPDWEPLRPILDEALHQLKEAEREAVLLRFYHRQDLRTVGEALGISDEAARKRVDRGLDKLRDFLSARGLSTSATALAAALSGQAATVAPAGLAATVTGAAVTAAAAASSLTAIPLVHLMATTKLKLTAIGTLLAATVATPLLIQQHRLAQLREENRRLAGQNEELTVLQIENQRLSNRVAQAATASRLPDDQFRELLRLRGEVGALRTQNRDLLA